MSLTKIPTNENIKLMIPDPQNPRFSYGGAKLIGEILTINYLKNLKLNSTSSDLIICLDLIWVLIM